MAKKKRPTAKQKKVQRKFAAKIKEAKQIYRKGKAKTWKAAIKKAWRS